MTNRLTCVIIIMLSSTLSENCLISSKNSKLSWVVSIRKKIDPDKHHIICIGLMISHRDVLIPSKCLSRKNTNDFYTGTELEAVSGIEEGSCTQTKGGVNALTSISPTLLSYIAILQVEMFAVEIKFEPKHELIRKLPQTEQALKEHWKNYNDEKVPVEKRVSCELLVFEPGNAIINRPKRALLSPLKRKTCRDLLCGVHHGKKPPPCPETMWSKDTFACLIFQNTRTTCGDFNMGSPIICNNSVVCGILKTCVYGDYNFGIAVMQMITAEHLDALAQSATIVKQPVLKSLGKELGEVICIEFSRYIEHLYVTVHIENKFTIRSLNDDAPVHEIYTDFTLVGAHWSSAQGNIVFGWGEAPHLAVYHVHTARRMALICPEGDHPSSPHVLTTAVNHKSPRLMAVGGSNGCVFVWEIPQYFRTPYD